MVVSRPPLNPIREIGTGYPTKVYDVNRLLLSILRLKMAQSGLGCLSTCWMVDVCDFGDQNCITWNQSWLFVAFIVVSFVASFIVCLVFFLLFFCLIRFVRLFRVRFFNYSVYFSVLILELYIRYFDPQSNNHLARDILVQAKGGSSWSSPLRSDGS